MSFCIGDINRDYHARYNYTVIVPLVARPRNSGGERAEKTKEGRKGSRCGGNNGHCVVHRARHTHAC